MKIVAGDFFKQGFAIVETSTGSAHMRMLREKFTSLYASRFQRAPIRNRNIIKLFAEDLDVKRFFCAQDIDEILKNYLQMDEPVQTGPIVTHYTADDLTGNNYGLPYHQDWPSMGTSNQGVIVWTSITDVSPNTPGQSILPCSHLIGLWLGQQTDNGYILSEQEFDNSQDIEINTGQLLLMSPYLVHKTKIASKGSWKLSLSCRFDDLACPAWSQRDYISAYSTTVHRGVYKK